MCPSSSCHLKPLEVFCKKQFLCFFYRPLFHFLWVFEGQTNPCEARGRREEMGKVMVEGNGSQEGKFWLGGEDPWKISNSQLGNLVGSLQLLEAPFWPESQDRGIWTRIYKMSLQCIESEWIIIDNDNHWFYLLLKQIASTTSGVAESSRQATHLKNED